MNSNKTGVLARHKICGQIQAMFLGIILVLSTQQAFSWGSKGHEIVAGVGASLAAQGNEFWAQNQASMEQLSTVPDRVWKSTNYKQEGPNHWFQGDAYTSDVGAGTLSQFPRSYQTAVGQMGEQVIVKNGTAPWRIQQFYSLALEALKKGDADSAITYAGVMSHYVGDLSQPLHVSENYDGVQTGQKGIHKFFETDNIKDKEAIQQEVEAQAKVLINNQNFVNMINASLMELSFAEIERSLMHRDEVLQNDQQMGRSGQGADAQLQLAIARMADGAATYAIILSRLWQEAQGQVTASQVSVGDPSWVDMDFSDAAQLRIHQARFMTLVDTDGLADDCEL